MIRLANGDRGVFAVRTETSVYELNLETRMLRRVPGAVRGSHFSRDGVFVVLTSLPNDNQWEQLQELLQCQVGAPLLAVVRNASGLPTLRRSTLVTEIRQLEGTPRSGAQGPQRMIDEDRPGEPAAEPRPPSSRPRFYDKTGAPISPETLARLNSDDTYRFLANDRVGRLAVVTVWLGIDQDHNAPIPLIFGTAVLSHAGTDDEDLVDEQFASNEAQALANHRAHVERLQSQQGS